MSKAKPKPTTVKLSDLLPDGHNANRGTERGSYMIRRSIEKFGFAEAGTLDKNNRIVGGNKRTEASADLGLSEDVIVIDVDGSRPVYIRRTDIDLETPEGRELAIALNRTAQVSIDFDPEEIAREQLDGVDLSEWFFENELDELVSELTGGEPATVEDDGFDEDVESLTDQLQAEWGTERGQIWEIASEDGSRVHRVMCGDSKEEGTREALFDGAKVTTCVTDPPYGIDFDTNYTRFVGGVSENRNHGKKIEGDAEPFDPAPYLAFPEVVMWGANCFSDRLPLGSWLIWDKRFENGKAWLADAEAAWSNNGYGIYIKQVTSQGFVRPEPVSHPTQKPIAIMAWCIERCKGERIYDPFLGSGTTLIAADQLGRTCYGMEIDPGYVAVILERAKRAGMSPTLADNGTT